MKSRLMNLLELFEGVLKYVVDLVCLDFQKALKEMRQAVHKIEDNSIDN